MADNPLAGDVKVPGIGPVPKKVLIPVVVGAGAFIAWRYYLAAAGGGDDEEVSDEETGYDTEDVLPSVEGAVRPGNDYGYGNTDDDDSSSSTITTNDAWARYAANELQSGGRSYDTVMDALGAYLARKPLTTAQVTIVQAALAAAGQPPVGTYSLVSGGNTALTVAPAGLRAVATGPGSVTLTFSAVPGAAGYRAFKDGTGPNIGSSVGTTMVIGNLADNTTYQFNVKPFTSSGTYGPASSMVTVKTKAQSLKKPNTPTVSRITKNGATFTTARVSGADGYNWYINGQARGHSDGPTYSVTSLKANTAYKVTVKADSSTGAPGPESTARAFRTKK